MASALAILGSLVLIYGVSLLYRMFQNLLSARKSGLPYIVIPWDQNSFFWMLASVPLRPWLATHMPKWINDRLSLTIFGFEFHERLRAFHQYAAPQGNDKSYAIVTTGRLEVHTRDPEIVLDVLRRPNDFLPMAETELFMNKFGSNVLTSSGESWARQRKLVAGVINERISRTVFEESIQQTQGLVDEVLAGRDTGETTRIFNMLKKITINVLSGAGMGASVEWNDDKDEKPIAPHRQTYMQAVKHVIHGVAGPIILPEWFLLNYPSFLPGYKTLKPLGYAMQEFPVHTRRKLDEERQRTLAAHGQTRSNIMAQLLQASEQGGDGTAATTTTTTTTSSSSSKSSSKSGPALSEDEMLGNLFIFTAAGFDTTANTLAYALALLCRYPSWQDWLFEEIDALVPPSTASSSVPDYAAVYPSAIRVQACLLEVLRIFPPVIHMAKMTKTPQRIHTSRGSFELPAGATVYSHNVGLHIDPEVWRNLNLHPGEARSDADELVFRPTRWLMTPAAGAATPSGSKDGAARQQHIFKPPKGSYVPWSAGPRVCPGQKMAQVEFTAIFLRLFQAHRIEAVALSKADGGVETREEVERRLDGRMKDSISILTLQMNDVYDVAEGDERGLKLRLVQRR